MRQPVAASCWSGCTQSGQSWLPAHAAFIRPESQRSHPPNSDQVESFCPKSNAQRVGVQPGTQHAHDCSSPSHLLVVLQPISLELTARLPYMHPPPILTHS